MSLLQVLITLQIISAVTIVVLVLLQQGKGADMGAAFGSGASGSLFGASGSANFLSRTTAITAACFFAFTMLITLVTAKGTSDEGVLKDYKSAPIAADITTNNSVPEKNTPIGDVPTPSTNSKTQQIPQ